MRRPSKLECVLVAANVAFCLLFITEFAQAVDTTACSALSLDAKCYPWGAEPVGNVWAYQSKAHYLVDIGIKSSLLLFVAVLPFLSAKRSFNLVSLMTAIPAILAFSWATCYLSQCHD